MRMEAAQFGWRAGRLESGHSAPPSCRFRYPSGCTPGGVRALLGKLPKLTPQELTRIINADTKRTFQVRLWSPPSPSGAAPLVLRSLSNLLRLLGGFGKVRAGAGAAGGRRAV